MCARTLAPKRRTYEEIAHQFGATRIKINEAWTDMMVRPNGTLHALFVWKGETVLAPVRFGFSQDGQLFNARADSMWRPTWAQCFAKQRCIIPVTDFFERGTKFSGTNVTFLAGLYGVLDDTFRTSILTTAANPVVAPVHGRMPVMVADEQVKRWINPRNNGVKAQPILTKCELHSAQAQLVASAEAA